MTFFARDEEIANATEDLFHRFSFWVMNNAGMSESQNLKSLNAGRSQFSTKKLA